jgi:hypothetical protein
MKNTLGISFALLATLFTASAQSERYASATVTATTYATNGNDYSWGATNSIEIAEGEAGELICLESGTDGWNLDPRVLYVTVTKNGLIVAARPASYLTSNSSGATPRGTTVAGPATFSLTASYNTGAPPSPQYTKSGLMTVKISPMIFGPDKTVVVAPGMGNVQVGMESSTDLVQWAWATNGVYSDNLRFFRIKLTKLTP